MRFQASVAVLAIVGFSASAAAQVRGPLGAPGDLPLVTVRASGSQIYECRANATGTLTWQFREPIAALFIDGRTVGRHYAGPSWELADGDLIVGKVVARTPGASAADIPQLRLEVTTKHGNGMLARASAILRVNTQGGEAGGSCTEAGALLSVPYSADYVFLRGAGRDAE